MPILMQPNPRAETSGPKRPSLRCFISVSELRVRADDSVRAARCRAGSWRFPGTGRALSHAKIVLHVAHTRDLIRKVLGITSGGPAVYSAGEGDLTITNADVYIGCVYKPIVRQPITYILADSLI